MSSIYQDIEEYVPNSGDSIVMNDSDQGNVVILAPVATIATLTINMPPNPHGGQMVSILSTQNVTSLTLVSSSLFNYIPGTILANGFMRFTFDPINNTWMDVGHDVSTAMASIAAMYRGKPFTITTTSGSATIYLTNNGLVGGTPLFSAIDYVHLDFITNDPNFGKSYTLSGVTLTVNAVKQAFSGITLLSTNVLGSVTIAAAVTGTQLSCLVVGKLN